MPTPPPDTDAPGFRYARRVQFAETDLAGIVHFSTYFRYMEEAEHALWRAAGLSIGAAGAAVGWPRVAATFDYRRPLTFEDEFEVVVRLERVSRRTIRYGCTLVAAGTIVGTGTLTTVCVEHPPGGAMRAIDMPADVLERLRQATGERA